MPTVPTTEFEDIDPDAVHLVKRGANGFPALLSKAVDDAVDAAKAGEDLAPDAIKATKDGDCPTCKGTGKIRDGHVKCPKCDGSGHAPADNSDDDAEKAVLTQEQRDEYAKTGVAMPNGDFPIPDAGHLTSAIGHLGNYQGDVAAAKKHVIKRAKALGLVDKLPADWGVSTKGAVVSDDGTVVTGDNPDDDDDAAKADDAAVPPADQKVTAALAALQAALEEAIAAQHADNEGWETGKTQADVKAGKHKAKKAGRRLSTHSITALAAARDHLNQLLGADDPAVAGKPRVDGQDEKAPAGSDAKKLGPFTNKSVSEEEHQMTKDELVAFLKERDNDKARKAAKAAAKAERTPEQIEARKQAKAEKAARKQAKKAESIIGQIEEAIAKSVGDTLGEVKDRLKTVEKMAAPGGPAKTRPPAALAKADQRDALDLEMADWQRKADNTTDQDLRKGYLAKARSARERLDALQDA